MARAERPVGPRVLTATALGLGHLPLAPGTWGSLAGVALVWGLARLGGRSPASEATIRRTIEKLRGELTILAISHQTGLVEAADRVYRLEACQAVSVDTRPAQSV